MPTVLEQLSHFFMSGNGISLYPFVYQWLLYIYMYGLFYSYGKCIPYVYEQYDSEGVCFLSLTLLMERRTYLFIHIVCSNNALLALIVLNMYHIKKAM